MGERTGRVKVRKLVGRDRDNLISKTKAACTNKAKSRINALLPIDRKPSPGKQGSIRHNCY